MKVFQKEISIKVKKRGFHLITNEILTQITEIKNINIGLCNIFIKHTSAGLTLNENADPDVRNDLEEHFNRLVPEKQNLYLHSAEGSDDMPAHIKSSILGASLIIPITKGNLNLGIWQGIYLCEHRDYGGTRRLMITLMGE